ncbi:MAG: EFR1 family ferrodoxin [Candidatus Thorarchaeota archaeon]
MVAKIFCFTGTGNSLMIAKAIALGLEYAEVIRITRHTRFDVLENLTQVGLIFPIYYGGLPSLVLDFLPNLKIAKGIYIFAVTTYAGGPGKALPQLHAELGQIDLRLSSGFNLYMPQNFIMTNKVPNEEEVNGILAEACSKIPSIVDAIKNKYANLPDYDSSTYSGQSDRYKRFLIEVNGYDTRFWCDESCTECEICVRVCPTQNIILKDGQLLWLGRCEQCLACLNWCPMHAIQHGTRTSEKGRYTNPRITLEEMKV